MAALLSAYHKFRTSNFDVYSTNEVAFLGLSIAMFARLINLEVDPYMGMQRWQSNAVRKLHKTLVERNANFSEAFDVTVAMLCTTLQIRLAVVQPGVFTTVNTYLPYNFCKRFYYPFFFGTNLSTKLDTICYRLRTGTEAPISFGSAYDYVTITIHAEALYKDLIGALKFISFDIGGKFQVQQQLPRFIAFIGKQAFDLRLDTISTSLNLQRRGCLEKGIGVWSQCLTWCSIESIASACNCTPLLRDMIPRFGELPANLESCARSEVAVDERVSVEACRSVLFSGYDFEGATCSRRCYKGDCETMFFTTTVRNDDTALDGINATTVVKLTLTNFVYQKVDEYITMDSKAFITALGGNLSLYLGASFLALIHIVVFFVKLPFELIQSANMAPETLTSLRESDGKAAPASAATKSRKLKSFAKANQLSRDDVRKLRRLLAIADRELYLKRRTKSSTSEL